MGSVRQCGRVNTIRAGHHSRRARREERLRPLPRRHKRVRHGRTRLWVRHGRTHRGKETAYLSAHTRVVSVRVTVVPLYRLSVL